MCTHPDTEDCTEHCVPQPPVGSWAHVARFMAEDDDSGFDWDAWKDQMKDEENR
jgi:hypothetical protein